MWEQVDVVLKDTKGVLDELQAYKGAGQEIREVYKEDPPKIKETSRKSYVSSIHFKKKLVSVTLVKIQLSHVCSWKWFTKVT